MEDFMGTSSANSRQNGGTITLHCGQYTTVYYVKNGNLDTLETFKLGKKFASTLVPTPIQKLMFNKMREFLPNVSDAVKIEQRITGQISQLRDLKWK
jgi:hypothetical protein